MELEDILTHLQISVHYAEDELKILANQRNVATKAIQELLKQEYQRGADNLARHLKSQGFMDGGIEFALQEYLDAMPELEKGE